ncbi:MAG: hypothetical protein COW71_03755 [Ignavibacteriales bacterium CG18_big_fil_WC_8_21_14_2_50_31_20]|nr:MAG: hypothetical protein COW71_03755 [Ignavibacteriales bacterium CG18_big_fil_WC_8_21_14_2_50_31_20]
MKNIIRKKLYVPLFLLILLFGCISPPNDFVAPSYNINISFPIMDSLLTINQFIKDDSSIVASDDPNRLGVLVYSKSDVIEPFFVSENLKIDAFSTYASNSIGTIKINKIPPIKTIISISEWTPISGGIAAVFPEISSAVTSDFDLINEFQSAIFQSGKLTLTIHNNLPITTEFRELKIVNKTDGSIVVESLVNSPILTAPFDSTNVTFDLVDASVTNSLEIQGTIYTQGSANEIVTLPQDAGTLISANLIDLKIRSVTGELPEQDPFIVEDSFIIDDSTKIEYIVLESGNFKIKANNYSDLDLIVNFDVSNLFDNQNNNYKQSFRLSRNEKNKVIEIPSLQNWSIKSPTSGLLTNKLSYTASITAEATNDVRTINNSDSVSFNLNFSKIFIASAKGMIKPTTFKIAESDFSFDLGDLKNNINFDSVYINNTSLILELISSVNFELNLNGIITASSDKISKQLKLNIDVPTKANKKIDLNDFGFTEFVNSFTSIGELPYKFIFSGSGTINPNYTIGSISKTDSVSEKYFFEIPLNFGIASGEFKDTLKVDSIKIDNNTIESISSIELTVETTNNIPINIIMSGNLLDSDNNSLFTIPPSYNIDNQIVIEAPDIDENGNVVTAQKSKQVITLLDEDAKTFINNPNFAVKFSLDTAPINNLLPVKFRDTDNIYFKIYGKVNYKVNN